MVKGYAVEGFLYISSLVILTISILSVVILLMEYKLGMECRQVSELRGIEAKVIGAKCYSVIDGKRIH